MSVDVIKQELLSKLKQNIASGRTMKIQSKIFQMIC